MTRLIWQFREPVPAPSEHAFNAATPGATRVLQALDDQVGFLVRPTPVVEPPPAGEALVGSIALGRPGLFHALPESLEAARRGLAILEEFSEAVDEAALELEVRPPELSNMAAPSPCQPVTLAFGESRPWDMCQGYLDPAPQGIDARHAWDYAGGRGEDVTLLDIEVGYNPDHEELRHVQPEGPPFPDDPHGTMSLGVCCAEGGDDIGVRGIAHEATGRFDSVEADSILGVKYRLVSAALWRWIPRLDPGSVILLELQARYYRNGPFNGSWFPVDVSCDVKQAIADAATKGIYVVEAAGNGNVDLDAARVTSRTEAILVGGGTVPAHTRWHEGFLGSNHGTRVDLHSWAEKVVTSGARGGLGHNLQEHTGIDGHNKCYTRSFNGTSSAAAIVAGAVACLSGILKANHIDPISPAMMRKVLFDTGTVPAPGHRIGRQPDLRKAIARLETTFEVSFRAAELAVA